MVALNAQQAQDQQKAFVKQREGNLIQLLQKSKKQIEMALPKHMRPDRMLRIILTELRQTPKLAECDPMSFMGAVVKAAQIGLEPGSQLGQAYLVPYGKECQLIIGYRGFIALARRSGEIKSITARVVRKGDEFNISYGFDESFDHKPLGFGDGAPLPDGYTNDDAITAAYAVAKLKDDGAQGEVLPRWKLDQRKKFALSKVYDPKKASLPWNAHFEEMCRKTAVRSLFKYLPMSIELDSAIAMDESAESGHSQNNYMLSTPDGDFIDLDYEPEREPEPTHTMPPMASTVVTGPKIEELRGHLKKILDQAVQMGLQPAGLGVERPYERDEKKTILFIETVSEWIKIKNNPNKEAPNA